MAQPPVHPVSSELTTETTDDPLRAHPSSLDESLLQRHPGGTHRRYKAGSPPRSEPVVLPSDGVDRAIDYFDFGPTKDAVVLVPELNRHVLSLAVDAEGVRQFSQASAVSQSLQGPIDRSLAAMPTASGVTAPGQSPYVNTLPNRKRSGRTGPATELPGLPLRPLAALTIGTMVGSAAAGVRRARRRSSSSSRQALKATGAPYANAASAQPRRRVDSVSGKSAAAGLDSSTSTASGLTSLYAPALGPPRQEADSAAGEGASLRNGGEAEGARQYYLNRYAPPLHMPPKSPRQAAAPVTVMPDPGALGPPMGTQGSVGVSVTAAADAPSAEDQLGDYLHGLHHHPLHQGQQQRSAPLLQLPSRSGNSDSSGPLPLLDPLQLQPAGLATSLTGAAPSPAINHPPSAFLTVQERRVSLAQRSASWRRSLAPDVEGSGPRRAASGFGHARATGSSPGINTSEMHRHSVHTVTPDLTPRGEVSDANRRASTEPGGVASLAAACDIAGAGEKGSREEAAGASSGRARTSRGRPRVVQVDPELVRQYTERPPKLCTPNNASRPVTSSDFAAFKNHTVNRHGAPNTLRTPLGSAAAGASAGASGGTGGPPVVEARGVPPLTALLGPPWLPPAMRPKSPHLGSGGVTGTATSVPGLFVPLELEPPARTPSVVGSPQQLGRSPALSEAATMEGGGPLSGEPGVSTPRSVSTVEVPPPPSQAPVVSARGPHAGPAPVRCGAGELALDVNAWLTPVSAPGSELCGVFYGDEGGDSVALMSRVVKGTVQCDLGWAEVSESLMFMSTSLVPNAVLRFALPHRAVLQRFAATIGGTTMIAEAVQRNNGNGLELDEEDEDDDTGPGKLFSKAFARRNHTAGPGGRAPMLRVPLGKVKGDIFVTVSYLVQLDSSGNTMSLTHVCNWTPPRANWHLMTREQLAAEWYGGNGSGRRGTKKASDLYDLSFELEILSHRGLNLVSGPRHMTIKPNYDALLIQGFTQVWRPRHVTQVIFEVALPVPVRSFAILHDARKPDADTDLNDVPRRVAQPSGEQAGTATASQQAQDAHHEGSGRPKLSRSHSIKLVIQPSSQSSTTALLGGELAGPYNGRRPQTVADAQRENWSRRNCAAVTFVPTSHFSPAELEEALGEEVAPGPRAQAAALRAGLPGTPPPVPAELIILVDCCGPTGMATHLMQMLQTLLLLLRSLPAADVATATGAGGVAGAAAAAAAIAAAGMFNVVICPGAPPPPEGAEAPEAQANPMWPPELLVLHSARRQQQQHILQQHLQATGQTPRLSDPARPASPSQSHATTPPPGGQDAAAPVWLFPGGPRPVTGEAVEAAMNWVATLVADPTTLVAWAQPISRLHNLLMDLDRLPLSPGCRRAAVLLCQQLKPDEEGDGAGQAASVPFTTPLASNATSRAMSRSGSRRSSISRLQPRRSIGRHGVTRAHGPLSAGRMAPMQAVLESQAEAAPGESEPTSPRSASAASFRQGLSLRLDAGPHVAFGGSSTPTATTPSTLEVPPPSPAPPMSVATDEAVTPSSTAAGTPPNHRDSGTPGRRPRSSFAHAGHNRIGTAGSTGPDGVRWSYGVAGSTSSRRGGTDLGVVSGDSDGTEVAVRHRVAAPSPTRSADEGGTMTDTEDVASVSVAVPDPPDLGFPVFVVVHSLPSHSHAALMAGPGGAFANGPSYLMAYQLYQRHLEGLLYERAREDVQQLPLSYFERLAEDYGGFVQAAESGTELGSALVLAASCACSGRYLRQLRLETRGAVLRERYPPSLPAALPLSEPLSLLVRLSKMQQGAALVLHGVWPNGRPASMDVSVDPKLKTAGTLLPVLCALSEVSALMKDLAPLAVPPPPRQSSALGYTVGGSGNTGTATTNPTSPVAGGGHASSSSPSGKRHALKGNSNSQLQLDDSAASPVQSARLTPKQLAARKKAMDRALAFNLVTPFTAMALVSMTLAGNRGLAVQLLQTTGGKPNDYRTGNFLWPSPVMTVLTAAAKEAAQAAAQAQAAAFHTAATFAQLTGALQPEADSPQGGATGAAAAAGGTASGQVPRSRSPVGGVSADEWGIIRMDTNAGSEFSDSEGQSGAAAGRRREGNAAPRRRSAAVPEAAGGLAALRARASAPLPLQAAGSRPAQAAGAASLAPAAGALPFAAARSTGSPAREQSPGPGSPQQQGSQLSPPPLPPALSMDALKASTAPIGPPVTAVAVTSAHALALLTRLAQLQQVDGSWPAGPELEDLVLSNGRHLHVPLLGGPKPATHMERHAADMREARLREALAGMREHTLRAAVSGPAWATVLVLALLRGKYGPQRLAWIAMEAKAFAWLQRKWPPPVVCAVSPPSAIMKVTALL